MAPGHERTLQLVREQKLAVLLPASPRARVLEASGVVAQGRQYFVVFDNIRRVARIGAGLVPGASTHAWVGSRQAGEGYEDIAYSGDRRRYYLLVEAEKHPDGTYKAIIEEYDRTWRRLAGHWVNFPFERRNTGFEGLAAVRRGGADYLLALCEGNRGRAGRAGRRPGGGRIQVLQKNGPQWQPVAEIRLPHDLECKDYSAVALRGDRLAVVSQKSSQMWIGRLRLKDWTIVGSGRTYEFPRTRKGKRRYCTVEGVDWLSADSFVMVSDLRKKGYPDRCGRTDQSIHIFRLGSR
jgi:hypothetical protein